MYEESRHVRNPGYVRYIIIRGKKNQFQRFKSMKLTFFYIFVFDDTIKRVKIRGSCSL